MIKRKYDKYKSRCYITVQCDFCGFYSVEIDGYGITSKEYFLELKKVGWERLKDGKIICISCKEENK